MSSIPSSENDRLALLQRHIEILVNQYSTILHSSSPHSTSIVNSNTDETKLRAATLAITSSVELLLALINDLRIDTLLLEHHQQLSQNITNTTTTSLSSSSSASSMQTDI